MSPTPAQGSATPSVTPSRVPTLDESRRRGVRHGRGSLDPVSPRYASPHPPTVWDLGDAGVRARAFWVPAAGAVANGWEDVRWRMCCGRSQIVIDRGRTMYCVR